MSKVTWNTNSKYYWAIAYFLVGSGIPLLLLITEFRQNVPSSKTGMPVSCFEEFIQAVVTVYSPLFLYGILVGFVLPLCIIPAYEFFKVAITDPDVHKIRRRLTKIAIVVALAVALADVLGGDAAIWEVKPPAHTQFVLQFIKADTSTALKVREDYKSGIEKELSKGMGSWSFTRYAYVCSILMEAFFLNAFYFTCFLFFSFQRALKFHNETDYYKLVNGLILGSLIIFVWLLLRTMNATEKRNLYPDFALQTADIGVGLLNIVCLFIILLARLNNMKVRQRVQEVLSVLGGIGITIASFFAYFNKAWVADYFGKKSGLFGYIVFPIVFLLLWMGYYLVNLGVSYNKKYNVPDIDEERPRRHSS